MKKKTVRIKYGRPLIRVMRLCKAYVMSFINWIFLRGYCPNKSSPKAFLVRFDVVVNILDII